MPYVLILSSLTVFPVMVAMPLPEMIGRYPVARELGRGGMGVVYHAHDPVLDRPVAIKLLSDELAKDAEQFSRFEREARMLARFNHPGIATIYGFDEAEDGRHFIVLEFIEGESLAARLKRAPLTTVEVLRIARQVSAALLAAHRRGIIHRDLKPANVLIDPESSAKVVDFGLAKSLPEPFGVTTREESEADTLEVDVGSGPRSTRSEMTASFETQAGVMMGTPSYMSPEQVRGQPVGQASDVFAFGCLLYESLSGKKAFGGETFSDLVAATLTAEPDESALPDDTPVGIRRLLHRCFEKDPARRLDDMEVVLAEISAALGTPTNLRAVRRRLEDTPNNLPRSLSSFVGREKQLARVRELLADTRLLTLTGPAGVGKTRLGLRAAEDILTEFPDGVWLVELGAVAGPDQMRTAVIEALGIREEPGKDCRQSVLDGLAGKTCLVILDNCEHLLAPAARFAEEVLRHTQSVRFLVTSRESLGLEGETVCLVPSLSFGDSPGTPKSSGIDAAEAVSLFVERARASRPGFRLTDTNAAAVARICRRLDGIPLAIELAAARVRSMAPERIAERLNDSFRLLTGGSRTALPRQQTMRAAFDWSFRLLSPDEQHLFSRLAVFAGGFALEAAETVCADPPEVGEKDSGAACPLLQDWRILDILTALVEKSLVHYEAEGDIEGRYRVLEMGREFGLEELTRCGDADTLRDHHLEYFLALAEEAEPALVGDGQREWLVRLGAEIENFESAIEWCESAAGGAEKSLRIVASIWRYWTIRGQRASGQRIVERVLSRPGEPSDARVKALVASGVMLRYDGELEAAEARLGAALEMARESGAPGLIAQALFSLSTVRLIEPSPLDLDDHRALIEESLSLFRQSGERRGEAGALNALGWLAHRLGDLDRARQLDEEALALRRAVGDLHGTATSLSTLGVLALEQGEHREAAARLEESLAIYRDLGARGAVGWVLGNLALVHDRGGDLEAARTALERGVAVVRELREKTGLVLRLSELASVQARMGDLEVAAENLAEAIRIAREIGRTSVGLGCVEAAADLSVARGDPREAAVFCGAVDALRVAAPATVVQSLRWDRESRRKAIEDELGAEKLGAGCAEGAALTITEALGRAERVTR